MIFRKGQEPETTANHSLIAQAQARFQEGLALHRNGQLAQAQEIYQHVLKLQPKHFEALHLLGVIAAQSRNYAQAVDFISRSIEINPDNAIAYANRGNALRDLGRYQAAIESYDQAIAKKPDYATAHFNRGLALHALKQHQAAVDSYNQSIAIKPDAIETYFHRGLALFELMQYQAAIESFDKTIALKPDSAEAYYNRANALYQLKQYSAAIESYDKVIAIRPAAADAYYNRGLALRDLKQYQGAIESFVRVSAINPDHEFLIGTRLYTKMCICDWRDADNQIAELMQKIQRNQKAINPFSFLALSTSLSSQRKAAEIWVKERHPAKFELARILKQAKGVKIRVGYFSADFHNHATAYLMAELFEQHDKSRFELVAFSFGPDMRDEMRTRLEAAFDKFIDVRYQSDQAVALLSRSLAIDIAIDLKGFTQDDRVGIFSYRAAPLQVSYLGYPGTMGADYMDYLIADRTLIPEQSQQHYSEKIVYLPHSYQVNDTKREIADKVFSREELGLPETGFVYCCFNNNYKITPDTFDGWMRILKRVQGSVLWLLQDNPTAASNLRKEAAQRGVEPQRLVFAQRMALPEHLARHRAADLFIDTLPYNAHTTASDALWAGLPVLTCTGEAFASRVAASLLNAIDLPELITSTQEEYEALVIELATNPERLKTIRQKLDRNRLTTPLFDTHLFAQHIEEAYIKMYQRYHADLPTDHIFVGQ